MAYGGQKDCDGVKNCTFKIQTDIDMMPRANLRVYAESEDSTFFLTGDAVLNFDQIGENYVSK